MSFISKVTQKPQNVSAEQQVVAKPDNQESKDPSVFELYYNQLTSDGVPSIEKFVKVRELFDSYTRALAGDYDSADKYYEIALSVYDKEIAKNAEKIDALNKAYNDSIQPAEVQFK